MSERDYVRLSYGMLPFTRYPDRLSEYLVRRFRMWQGARLLDLCCGRGEYTRAFAHRGIDAHGVDEHIGYAVDETPIAMRHRFVKADVNLDWAEWAWRGYDFIFAKSVLEHFYYPEMIAVRMFDALHIGGKAIVLVPDWEVCYRTFFGDFQHRHPFVLSSLVEAMQWAGFENVKGEHFIQSPPVWRLKWVRVPLALRAKFPGASNDAIFAQKKYRMLLVTGRKGKET